MWFVTDVANRKEIKEVGQKEGQRQVRLTMIS